jgi:hypothetical protein
MTSIRTALASALAVATLCTLGAYASHEAASQAGVSHPTAGPVLCCYARTSQAGTATK